MTSFHWGTDPTQRTYPRPPPPPRLLSRVAPQPHRTFLLQILLPSPDSFGCASKRDKLRRYATAALCRLRAAARLPYLRVEANPNGLTITREGMTMRKTISAGAGISRRGMGP